MNIVVTQLSPEEWQKYSDIRLRALKSDPDAFCSSYDREMNFSETEWRDRIEAMWFALVDGQLAGLVGLVRTADQTRFACGEIVSLWVIPAYRGRGIAERLLQKLQNIAKDLGLSKLSLQVTASQIAAIKLYEKLGFDNVGVIKDGNCLDKYVMEWQVKSS